MIAQPVDIPNSMQIESTVRKLCSDKQTPIRPIVRDFAPLTNKTLQGYKSVQKEPVRRDKV